jgi:hypothetical protein
VRLGVALIVAIVLVQVPFAILASTFDYPDILREPAAVVLARYRDGGVTLTLAWYAFAASVLPMLVVMVRLPHALVLSAASRSVAVVAAAISGAVQLVGLLRWTLVVPVIAAHAAAHGDTPAVALVFEVQHQLFGVLLGEHVGQLMLAAWTWVVVGAPDLPRALWWAGRLSAVLVVVGLVDGWATVRPLGVDVGTLPVIGFGAWALVMLGLGVVLIRRGLVAERGSSRA